jgi:hypothetical protein
MKMGDIINKYANASIPGAITRANPVIADREMDSTNPLLAYGAPGKMSGNELEAIEAGDVASDFYGILSRLAPSIGGAVDVAFLSGTPNSDYLQAVLIKGYIAVICSIGTPVIGAPVYMRVVTEVLELFGQFEATEDVTIVGTEDAGNTGTGTVDAEAFVDSDLCLAGVYEMELTETSGTAAFTITDPAGNRVLPDGAVETVYTNGLFTFEISDGGTMTTGDKFYLTVTRVNVKLPNVTWSVAGTDDNDVSEVFVR